MKPNITHFILSPTLPSNRTGVLGDTAMQSAHVHAYARESPPCCWDNNNAKVQRGAHLIAMGMATLVYWATDRAGPAQLRNFG